MNYRFIQIYILGVINSSVKFQIDCNYINATFWSITFYLPIIFSVWLDMLILSLCTSVPLITSRKELDNHNTYIFIDIQIYWCVCLMGSHNFKHTVFKIHAFELIHKTINIPFMETSYAIKFFLDLFQIK